MLEAMSRTRDSTSSSGNNVAVFTFGSSELRSQTAGITAGAILPVLGGAARSQVTNETSASGSASAAAGVWSSPATESVRSFCGLYGGILAERLLTVSDRLPATRT